MKQVDLIKRLRQIAKVNGGTAEIVRSSGGHDMWSVAGVLVSVPRHREINELTAKSIIDRAEEGR